MQFRAFPLIGAAGLGFAAAALLFSAAAPRPADAQFRGTPGVPNNITPLGPPPMLGNASTTPAMPQPIEIQSLGPNQFVVATREPRLVQQIGREGSAQQMLVTVVTHYTVRNDRLLPMEHVRVPTGFRAIDLDE